MLKYKEGLQEGLQYFYNDLFNFKHKNIYESTSLYISLARFYNHAGYSIKRDLNKSIVYFRWYGILFQIFYQLICVAGFLYNLLYNKIETQSKLLNIGNDLFFTAGFAITIISSILNNLHYKKLWKFFKIIYQFDNNMSKIEFEIDHKKESADIFNYLIATQIFQILAALFTAYVYNFKWISFSFLTKIHYAFVMSQYIILIKITKNRMKSLNKYFIEKFFQTPSKDENQFLDILDNIGDSHSKLTLASEYANMFTSFQVMIWCVMFIVYCIYTIFALYRSFSDTYDSETTLVLIHNLVWLVFLVQYFMYLIIQADKLEKEVCLFDCWLKFKFNEILFDREKNYLIWDTWQ